MGKLVKIFQLLLMLIAPNLLFAELQINYESIKGVWAYFHITSDYFTTGKLVGSEQRLFFQDNERVVLDIIVKERDYRQNTTYQLRYSLSLRDNVPYITLFSDESDLVLGAYLRMPYKDSLEMASDPNFSIQKQLYQRKDIQFVTPSFPTTSETNITIP